MLTSEKRGSTQGCTSEDVVTPLTAYALRCCTCARRPSLTDEKDAEVVPPSTAPMPAKLNWLTVTRPPKRSQPVSFMAWQNTSSGRIPSSVASS